MEINTNSDSALHRRRNLYALIRRECHGIDVINELLPNGKPHEVETPMWDYKEELPYYPSGIRLSDGEKSSLDFKYSGIVKDAVAFYNSYGGYLVIGVSDKPRKLLGWNKNFDCDELNKKIKSATNHNIRCHYSIHNVTVEQDACTIGLLLIPQRPDDIRPAQFLKDGPSNCNGKREFVKNSILFREGHECRPAETAEDYHFLCSQHRRQFVAPRQEFGKLSILDNTLGARDPGFIRFVGRSELLSALWRWLCDRYVPVKLLAGLGGVGKTTLAREFAEEVVHTSPMGFERVIWLTAKKRLFEPHINAYSQSTQVDFFDPVSLFRAILLQLGNNEDHIDPDWTLVHLVENVIEALRIVPSFIIIDDIDTLDAEAQSEVFHMAIQVANQTQGGVNPASKVLMTARLSLGATATQLMRIPGLALDDFREYVKMTAQEMGMPEASLGSEKDVERLWKTTEGSPTFASSILRLVDLGQPMRQAVERWKGGDGEEVRKFAFEKELEQLMETQIRTLYALCLLGETSQVELRHVTQSTEGRLSDDLSELRKYHLVAHATDLPVTGPRLRIPEGIRMMAGLIRKNIHDPNVIDRRVREIRFGSPEPSNAGQAYIIHRVVALWKEDRTAEALSEVQFASKRNPKSADLKCLMGRAYLRVDPPDPRLADKAFSEAARLGCRRPELNGLWIETKKMLGDWRGLIDITPVNESSQKADTVYVRGEAFGELADAALKLGNTSEATEFYLKGAQEIERAFVQGRASGRVMELKEMRTRFLENYVTIIDKQTPDRERHLEVWLAMREAFKHYLRSPSVIRLGLDRLTSWWAAVEEREKLDETSSRKMLHELHQLDNIIASCRRQSELDLDLIDDCRRVNSVLSERQRAYSERLSSVAM